MGEGECLGICPRVPCPSPWMNKFTASGGSECRLVDGCMEGRKNGWCVSGRAN